MTRSVVIGALASCAGAFVLWRHKDDVRRTLSSLAQTFSSEPAISAEVARDMFAETEFVPPKPVRGHTHATAAAARSAATGFCRKFAHMSGGRLFSLSMSKSDQRKGIAGERQWYWAKDVNADNRDDPVAFRDVLYLCDVDYYKDMPYLLSTMNMPTVLYTMVPESSGETGVDNTSFFFDADGYLNTLVSGGGSYRHRLWDYGSDSVLAVRRWFGVPVQSTVYAIERKQVAKNRQIILLSPIRIFTGLGALLSLWLLESKPLKWFNPIVHTSNGPFVRFNVHSATGTQVTTARAGSVLGATVDAAIDEAIASVARLGKTSLMLPTVLSWIGNESDKRKFGTVLTEYHRTTAGTKHPTVYPVELAVRSYNYQTGPAYDQDEQPKLQAFMSPLVDGAFCPVANEAGEQACVEGRINRPRKPEPKPSTFVDQCMIEFADLVVGEATLHPVGVESVVDKQTRSAQRLSLARAMVSGPFLKSVLKCFIKAEAYADVKDPRNISTYNDVDKLTMAQFALALSEHCKQFPWYGPGKTPIQIAERVAEICQGSEYVNQSDLWRMDGTITAYLRNVDRLIFMKAFEGYGSQLNELLKSNYDNIGILPHGTRFEQGTSHGSGCSATSLSQTLRATFLAYLAFRHTRSLDGDFYGPAAAFGKIGLHFGDDGLDGGLPISSHQWAAERVGLVLEAQVVCHGEPGITFLARYYSSEVWFGRLDSMCDVRRQLSKFHTSVRLPSNVTAEEKLCEKARGYAATDRNTPVIGELCTRAVDLSGSSNRTEFGIAHWWSKFDGSVQFPNSNDDGWMDAEFQRLFPEFDRGIFDLWLSTVSTVSDLLKAPLCVETKPATPTTVNVVVDGDVLPARTPSKPATPTDSTSVGEQNEWQPAHRRNARGRRKPPA